MAHSPKLSRREAARLRKERTEVLDPASTGTHAMARTSHTQLTMMHHGPLPPPSYLQKYEEACPGAAERIIAMAEKEQAHRHAITREQESFPRRGQVIAGVLVVLGLCVSTFAIYCGHPGAGGTIATTALGAAGVAAFFRRPMRRDRKDRAEDED